MVNNSQRIGSAGTLLVSEAVRKSFSPEIAEGHYLAKLAQTPAEVESALRLRYEVFNLELSPRRMTTAPASDSNTTNTTHSANI